MIFDYSYVNIGIYFFTGLITSTILKQYIFGGLIVFLSFGIALQYFVSNSTNPSIYKFSRITPFFAHLALLAVLISSFYILSKSKIEVHNKLYSLAILSLSIVFYIFKELKKNQYEILRSYGFRQIPSILFMLYLIIISILPENEHVLFNKINEIRYKTEIKNL